jgi:hypothetical protein
MEGLSAVPWQSSRPWAPEPSSVISAEQSACARLQAGQGLVAAATTYCGMRTTNEELIERSRGTLQEASERLVVRDVFFVSSLTLR